ncbi:MAG: MFS transporter [Armatimonadetes bacterium]|nr:MFS transporter [Armatimonadota bacterium]
MSDSPLAPVRPDDVAADAEATKAAHFAWNLRVNVAVELWWGLGLALVSSSTIVPVFLSRMGASPQVIALVPGIGLVGLALLQLPSAYFTTRLRHKTLPTIYVHLPVVAAWLGAALIAHHLAAARPELARVLFLVALGAAALAGGVGIPLWADYLNRQTPAHSRGRFFGWAFAAGSTAGLAGGFLAQRLLERLAYPLGFAACFYVAAAVMFLGLLPYLLVREVVPEPARFPSPTAFVAHVRDVLTRRGNLRRLLIVRCLMEAGMMSSAFYAVRALSVGGFSDAAAGTFTVLSAAAQAPAMLLAGYVGDRYGFRTVLAAGGLCASAATGLALFGATPGAFYALFACVGCAVACEVVGGINLVMALSPEDDKTVYQAAYNTLLVPVRVAYPLIAGWLAGSFAMTTVFAIALPLQLLGAAAALLVVREGAGPSPRPGEP